MEKSFTHLNPAHQPHMVNVTDKAISVRTCKAEAIVSLPASIMDLLENKDIITAKGSVFQTAILAGIMAAKKTGELIPLCHPIPIHQVEITIEIKGDKVYIQSFAKTEWKTGIEMEALTAVSIAALTIYDMCKALSHDIAIEHIRLIEKTGGKHDFSRH